MREGIILIKKRASGVKSEIIEINDWGLLWKIKFSDSYITGRLAGKSKTK